MKNIFIILFFIKIIENKIIVLNFNTKQLKFNKEKSYLENYFYNLIYTNFKIGNPSQKIESFIFFNISFFYIKGNNLKNYKYDQNKSSTFKEIYETSFLEENYNIGIYSEDSIKIKDNKNKEININNYNFILSTELSQNSNDYLPSEIGFNSVQYGERDKKLNIITTLFERNITKSKIFSFEYESKEKGKIIIGDFPHNYNKNYNKNSLHFTKAQKRKDKFSWDVLFDDIIFLNYKMMNERKIYLSPESNLIVGSKEFHEIILNNFFKEKINKKICFEEEMKNLNYLFYYCNKNFDIKKFDKIKFISKDLNKTFELDFNDVFDEFEGKIYFKIVFNENKNFDYFILGKPFLIKYKFVFNADSNEIGFYNNNLNNKNVFSNFIIFILIIFILILIFLIFKYRKKMKKIIRKYELNDNYEYFFK